LARFVCKSDPVLIVVDYAETKRSELKLLLAKVREFAKASTFQIRIVLLARTDVQWWGDLRTNANTRLKQLPDKATELTRVSEEPRESYRRALTAFAHHLDKDIEKFQLPSDSQLISKSDSVLFLHMQALLNVVGKAEQGLISENSDDEELDVLNGVLSLEQENWLKEPIENLSQDSQKAVFAELMTAITLGVTPTTLSEVRTVISELPTVQREDIKVGDAIAKRCIHLYSNNERLLDALRPDILGEHLVEQTLLPAIDDSDTRSQLLELVYDHDLANEDEALAVLVRLSQRQGESGTILLKESLVGRWEQLAFKANDAMPWETVELREVALETAEYCAQNVDGDESKASSLIVLGYRYNQLGRREEALQATQKAVEIRQKLSEERPDAFLPDLAMSLQ